MANFTHKQLVEPQDIRLIRLYPGDVDDTITCDVLQVSLDDDPIYRALSYTWGDLSSKRSIYCNGLENFISTNLYDALQELRLHGEDLLLWVDQLCIDQSNLDERNHQVSIMAKIYKKSAGSLAFIGKATEADVQALALMEKVVELWDRSDQKGISFASDPEVLEDNESLNLPPRSDVKWRFLRNLMARPWFSRVWIVQEAVLPPECKLFVGQHSFTLTSLKTMINVLASNSLGAVLVHGLGPDERDSWLRTLVQIANLTSFVSPEAGHREHGLAHVLHRFRVTGFSDPRDKVYGVLGRSNYSNPDIVPDYGLSFQEIYRRTASALVTKGQGFKVLYTAATNSRKEVEGLPSWVPDWRMVNVMSEAWFETYHDYAYYKANVTKAADMQLHADPMCVTARGCFVDTIVLQTEVFRGQSTEDVLMITEQMLEWWAVAEQALSSVGSYPTGECGFEAFWQTLMGSQAFSTIDTKPKDGTIVRVFLLPLDIVRSAKPMDTTHSWCGAYNTALRGLDVVEVNEQVYSEALCIPLTALGYQRIFWGSCHARRFCTTSKGYFGVAPQQARVGDRICVFPGQSLPFLLRLRQHSRSYEAIGGCYVRGISDGEVWKWNDFRLDDIVIWLRLKRRLAYMTGQSFASPFPSHVNGRRLLNSLKISSPFHVYSFIYTAMLFISLSPLPIDRWEQIESIMFSIIHRCTC